MSKGFGSVQRKIAEILAANIDDAFRVDELCRKVYGDYLVEKKQRVSVIRAAKALVKKRPDLSWTGSGGPRGDLCSLTKEVLCLMPEHG